jgi:hypothetical protein
MSDFRHQAYMWNNYLKRLMTKLQNRARQEIFKQRLIKPPCKLCGEMDVQWFYVDYGSPPTVMSLCQRCHKDASQRRGSLYDQLKRNGIEVISWEEWKNDVRPAAGKSKR